MASVKTIKDCLIGVGFTKKEVREMFTENPALETDSVAAIKYLSGREKKLLLNRRNHQLDTLAFDRANKKRLLFLSKFPGQHNEALNSLLVRSSRDFAEENYTEGVYHGVKSASMGKLTEYMDHHKGKWKNALVADREFGENYIRELGGKSTGDALAAKAAKEIREVAEELRLRYNRAGGDIGKLEDWYGVQSHDALKMVKGGAKGLGGATSATKKARWKAAVRENYDLEKSGLFKPDEQEYFLDELYEDMTTRGATAMEPGDTPADAVMALASRKGARHRVLHPRSAEHFLEYQKEFGSEDHFASLFAHIDTMARDIAVMETFGPNATNNFKKLLETARKEAGNNNIGHSTEKIFADVMGETMAKNHVFADVMGSVRSVQVAGKLGSAALATISDYATMGLSANFTGIPVMKMYGRLISQVFQEGDRAAAARITGIMDIVIDSLSQQMRYDSITGGSRSTRRIAQAVIRGSGMEWLTNNAKRAFSMEMAADLARKLKTPVRDLPDVTKRLLDIYGITDADWRALKGATETHRGAKYLSMDKITDPKLQAKYASLMRSEMKFAVLEPGWREQAFLKQGTQSGTFTGEVLRSAAQFKAFTTSMMMSWWARILYSQALEGTLTRAGYAGALLTMTTMTGTMSVMAYDVAKGKELPDIMDPRTLARGFLKGGGGAGVTDFISQGAQGRTLEALAGPSISEAVKISNMLLSNANRFIEGEDTHLAHGLVKAVQSNTPTIWPLALGTRRLLGDTVDKLVDPQLFRENSKRAKTRLRKDNQEFYWPPN